MAPIYRANLLMLKANGLGGRCFLSDGSFYAAMRWITEYKRSCTFSSLASFDFHIRRYYWRRPANSSLASIWFDENNCLLGTLFSSRFFCELDHGKFWFREKERTHFWNAPLCRTLVHGFQHRRFERQIWESFLFSQSPHSGLTLQRYLSLFASPRTCLMFLFIFCTSFLLIKFSLHFRLSSTEAWWRQWALPIVSALIRKLSQSIQFLGDSIALKPN